MNEMNENAVI